jgi:hypothetical protein
MNDLLTSEICEQLLLHGRRSAAGEDHDPTPVVKLFTPDAHATWLLTEVDPSDMDLAFGLCDLGLGHPELGYVRLSELQAIRGPLGLAIERDKAFRPLRSLSEYARLAAAEGRIRR